MIAHDMRSTFNVGSLLRTAEGLGVVKVYLTGYTPYPRQSDDTRLPHLVEKLHNQIHKVALGAEELVPWEYRENIFDLIKELKDGGFVIAALEQTTSSIPIANQQASKQLALLLGTEVTGLPEDVLKATDQQFVIPMLGSKESFNVVQAAAMALYEFRFH